MYNINRTSILRNWGVKCYIARKLKSDVDEFGNEIPTYDTPQRYTFNIQPVSAESETKEFGELATNMRVAVITPKNKYLNLFNEFDLAYLDGATPYTESFNGANANYRIYAIRPQNVVLKVYFLKIIEN
jgi:hypothetical protein